MLRAALLVVSALTTGVTVGRKAISGAINKKKKSIIEQAAKDARHRIRGHAEEYLRESIATFVTTVFVKAMMLMAAWLGYRLDLYNHTIFSIAVIVLIVIFLIRDVIVTFPSARFFGGSAGGALWPPRRGADSIGADGREDKGNEAHRRGTGGIGADGR